ncbi:uncharacterized protein LOC126965142 [Leptidea sinapis]|uniref:uncharacterized protein LOC126965142 n=1 Tax=Leptidea sinapis TaxID=189913 RepID=UPI0021C27B36|nr:uncharacterized protein LOC126965142 [Leptidea sinapis]
METLKLNLFGRAHEDFFIFNEKYLYYVGLWPDTNVSRNRKIIYYIYEMFIHVLSMLYLLITGIGTYEFKNDFVVLMSNLDKTLVAYNFVLKTAFFVLKRNDLKILINEIKNSGDRVSEGRKRLMISHIIVITALSTSIVSAFCLLSTVRGEMTVEAWMPFNPLKNKKNLLISMQLLAVTFIPCMYRAFAIQGIVCTIIMYFCDQLDDLQDRMRNLVYSVENEITMKKEFKDIIKKHVRLIGYSKQFTSIFKEFFLVQNLAVTIELCLSALMVSVSQGIADAAFDSSWTSWPAKLQKDLLIVIRAAQKPLKLSAGGISVMCIQTYSQALYNAYSIFAVLNDIVD